MMTHLASRRGPPWSTPLLAALVQCLVLGAATPALAEDVTTVEMGPAGPNQQMPVGKAFFLKGEEKTADKVNVVFVRTAFHPFAIGGGPTCEAVKQDLGPPKAGMFVREAPAPGSMDGDVVFRGSKAGEYRIFAGAGWSRTDPKEDKYTLRISEDTAFFRPGARFCMFLYSTGRPLFEAQPFLDLAQKFATNRMECKDPKCEDDAFTAFSNGADELIKKAVDAEKELCPAPSSSKDKPCWSDTEAKLKKIKSALGAAAAEMGSTKTLAPTIAAWPKLIKSQPVDGTQDITPDKPLASFLLRILEGYFEVRGSQNGSSVDYYHPEGIKIAYIKVGLDLKTIEVADGQGEKAKRKALKVDTSKLLLPDSTVSVRDVLELSHGNLLTDAGYVRVDQQYAAKSDRTTARLKELRTRLETLKGTLRRAPDAKGSSPSGVSRADIYKDLGKWLLSDVLGDCDAWAAAAQVDPKTYCAAKEAGASVSTFVSSAEPFEGMIRLVDNPIRAAEDLDATGASFKELHTAARVKELSVIRLEASFQAESWVTQFVTPTVGVAFATRPEQPLAVVYGGIKVYPWPNPVDEPMWRNGAIDLARLFALEIALGTTSSGLGQDHRFSGPGAGTLPPVLVGGSLQLLPWGTFSMGAMFLEAKRSTLTLERPYFFPSFYAGLSIDANVFDAVASVFTKGRTAAGKVITTAK